MRYVALFSILFLMTFSLYAENKKLAETRQIICQPDEYIPFMPSILCEKHNISEQSSQNLCFNIDHFAFMKHQCQAISKLKETDPHLEAHYQSDQNKFSTIEF